MNRFFSGKTNLSYDEIKIIVEYLDFDIILIPKNKLLILKGHLEIGVFYFIKWWKNNLLNFYSCFHIGSRGN